jgi:VWFA-related protein
MDRHHRAALVLALLGIVAATIRSDAQQPPAQRATGSLTTNVTAVLVDVVVRDKHGMLVRDLQPSDFEVFEDGVSQTIGSVTPIFEAAAAVAAVPVATSTMAPAAPAAAPASKPAAVPVTALVFDRLTPEARQIAIKAAKSYLGDKQETANYMGVFGIDLSLKSYTPFTRNVEELRKGIDSIENRASASFGMDKDRLADVTRSAAAAQQSTDSAAAAAGGPGGGSGMGSSGATAQLADMEARMLSGFEALERDEAGYSQVNALYAMINAMRSLPGRKSVLLFSEGVSIPPAVQRLFLGVIDAANRANVSIYTMDAAGLRAESEQAKIRDQVNAAGNRNLNNRAWNAGASTEPMTKALEKNEDVLRQDPHTGLGELAQNTGGQIFENTNNLKQGFERLDSDLRNYYLVGYTPANGTYDGRFRSIDVKVKRPGMVIAARKGYFAVRDTGGAPVNPWEAPALAALDRRPVPNAFPIRAGALNFPSSGHPGMIPVVVDLKTAPMSFPPSEDQKTFKSDFAIVVRFLGPKNEVVKKIGQHYEMAGELDKLDIAKNSEVIFYREPELAPGVYTMETIVYDNPSGKASVRYTTVEVPKIEREKLRMSSLVIVKKGEKVPEGEPRTGPLFVKDVLIYPNLGDEVSRAAKELGFFFTVYPAAGAAPQALLELIQNGKALAQVPLPLDAADPSGQIQQVGRLPIGEIPAGTYELRVIVKQGSEQVFRSAMLHVAD